VSKSLSKLKNTFKTQSPNLKSKLKQTLQKTMLHKKEKSSSRHQKKKKPIRQPN